MFKIDKGIPIPPDGRHGGGGKYPWADMEIGDSFAVLRTDFKSRGNFTAVASSAGKRLTRKFTVRAVEENGVQLYRVWRVE